MKSTDPEPLQTTAVAPEAKSSSDEAQHAGLRSVRVGVPGVGTAGRTRTRLERWSVPAALIVAIVIFSILLPQTFPTFANFKEILTSESVVLLLVLGVMFPLRTNNFDLSFASLMLMSAAITATVYLDHGGLGLALLAGIGSAVAGAGLNAWLVVGLGLDGFISTLGTGSLFTGVLYAVTNSQVIVGLTGPIVDLTATELLGLPIGVWIGWLLAVIVWVIFEFTPFGRYTLFIGGNRDAARLAGIPVRRYIVISYLLEGVLASFAGVLLIGSLQSVDPTISGAYLLPPFAAVFLGAACIKVGRINVWGAVVALYFLAVGSTGLSLYGASAYFTQFFNGALLIAAIAFARLVRKKK